MVYDNSEHKKAKDVNRNAVVTSSHKEHKDVKKKNIWGIRWIEFKIKIIE